VFTVRVRMPADGPSRAAPTSRRAILAAAGWATAGLATAGLGGVAGCDIGGPGPEPPPPPDALLPFLTATAVLADQYDAAIDAQPSLSARLTPLRDDHRAHIRALAREIGTSPPSPSASASAVPSSVQALLAAEEDAQKDAEKACLDGPSYRAALLGSIAACRASHREALR
jgi:hypothetical protein